MYAVIQTGGKQYRVRPGDLLVVDKLAGAVGDVVAFEKVLLIGEGPSVTVGAPLIEGASVSATLVETRKARKIKIFKKIRRQGYRRTRGHRQWESVLRVTALAGAGQSETWDGKVSLISKAELDARARGFAPVSLERAKAAVAEEAQAIAEMAEEATPQAAVPAPAAKAAARRAAAPKAAQKPTGTAAKPAAAKARPAAKKPAAKPAPKKVAPPAKAAAPGAKAKAAPKGKEK